MSEDDDVDSVIDAWASVLPDVDFAPLDVVSRLRRLGPRLLEVRRRSFAASDLRPSEFELMSILRQHGEPGMTPSALAARLEITSGNLSARLDRLATRGLISRRQNDADARSKIVSLTPRGGGRVDDAMRALVAAESEVLAELSRPQAATLIESLRIIGRSLDQTEAVRPR
ncbi:MarR family transcriptional regulator [Microbacteriaceae bacterium VKM Ac-2855]|nr:MarR family transcriptional regulator [Microbacteriaceae bacterium VKM Ac-2855]